MECFLKRAVFFFVLLFSTVSYGAGNQWIVGTWELFHDPDGHEKDWIEFTESGRVTSFADSNTKVPGSYEIDSDGVHIIYEWYGQSIPIVLTYQNDKTALYAFSARTGNTSTYKKKP